MVEYFSMRARIRSTWAATYEQPATHQLHGDIVIVIARAGRKLILEI